MNIRKFSRTPQNPSTGTKMPGHTVVDPRTAALQAHVPVYCFVSYLLCVVSYIITYPYNDLVQSGLHHTVQSK